MASIGPLLVIVGETASGKSSLAMELAEKCNGEIIAADSTTVYKEFDIGTAKPSDSDRRHIPHHLLDVVEASQKFDAAQFKQLANQAISEIHARGNVPIMVGGSGLYIDSVLFDYSFAPAGDPSLRAHLEAMTTAQLIEEAQSKEVDLSGVDTRNKRRLIRAIETQGHTPQRKPLRKNTTVLGLQISKEELTRNISQRVKTMFREGLVGEVAHLKERYGWDIEPMKGIGYREFKPYFMGVQSLEQAKTEIIKDTLKFAKKQRTWFKRNKSIHWVSNKSEAVAYTTTILNK